MKINDIIKHKKAYYYYVISSIDKINIVLKRVYYCTKKHNWIIDYNNKNEFGTIDNILPVSSLKYFEKTK
jgi:Uri superfamily endonuclease